MAKLQTKSDNINPFGGLFSIFKTFDKSGVRNVIDRTLGPRGTLLAFSHGDIFASLLGCYLTGGDCIEDVMDIKPFWDGHGIRIASSDTIERALRKLSEENTSHSSESGKTYKFNVASRMNSLMLKCMKVTGQLNPGDSIDLDFDHQFIPAGKKDAEYSYKNAFGYFPGVASVGGLIVGIENRDGNTNVKFHQKDTLERIFGRLENESRVLVRNFRADCGSFSEDIITYVSEHCEHFYIRANNCGSRRTEFMEHEDWTEVEIRNSADKGTGHIHCGVTSFKWGSFLSDRNLRLVVQRTKLSDEVAGEESNSLFGTEYVYRCILTNDWDNSEKAIIEYYNKRGASERNFDCQNNDFGWAHLPFSFLKENTVFLIATAILKNFYLYFLDMLHGRAEGIDCSTRIKRFVRKFVTVPAKWTRSARTDVLTLYTKRQIYLSLCC